MNLTKRLKISISVVLLCAALWFLPNVNVVWRLWALLGTIFLSYLLSIWALATPKSLYKSIVLRGKELSYEVKGIELVTLFSLPVVLTAAFGIYFFQFVPNRNVMILATLGYGVVLYVILLVENIFNVASERSIPLLRAAYTVGYLATLFVAFVFFSLLWGLGFDGWLIALISFVVSMVLFFQAIWQVKLKESLNSEITLHSLLLALAVAEISWMLSFWPLRPLTFGLDLTTAVYVLLGVDQHRLRGDLTKRTSLEYILVGVIVFILLLTITSWP